MKRLLTLILLALSITAHADMVLREDTASQTVQIGPFVDDAGAIVTGLTIANTDVRLSKNGGNIVGKNSGGCTYDEVGMYACTFDATDSDTAGRLQVIVVATGALPVYHEFQVATQSVFDSCCASTSTAPAADGSDFTAIPWNASWDAEVQSEATDALNAYDPPTRAELTSDVNGLLSSQRIITGTCDSGSTTTCVDDALTQADATQLEDRLICFDDSWCALITTFTPGTDTATTTKTAPSTRASKAYTIFPATLE